MRPALHLRNLWGIVSLGVTLMLTMIMALAPEMVSAAGNKALDILRKSAMARGEVSYSGVASVITYHNGKRTTMTEIIHRQQGARQRLKLYAPNGKLVCMLVSDGKTVWEHQILQGRLYQRTLPTRNEQLSRDLYALEVLRQNFQVTLLGNESVAGRAAYRIRISHPGPPEIIIRDVWIDQNNYTELRTDKFGDDNRLQHSVMLQRINLHPTFSADTFTFHPPPNVTVHVVPPPKFTGTLEEVQQVVHFQPLPPPRVPKGFSLFGKCVTVQEFRGVPVIWFQLTNGVRTFSVFQRPISTTNPPPIGESSSRTIRVGNHQFTIVGPLNHEEFEIIKAGYQQH